jgi:hypothetical protein
LTPFSAGLQFVAFYQGVASGLFSFIRAAYGLIFISIILLLSSRN